MPDEQVKPENTQKMMWNVVAKYPTFQEADKFRNTFKLKDGQKIKVHKMAQGTVFAVKVGDPLSKLKVYPPPQKKKNTTGSHPYIKHSNKSKPHQKRKK